MKHYSTGALAAFVCALLVGLSACSKKNDESPVAVNPSEAINSCEGCHTNYAALKRLASPDTATGGGGGCGGETPHIEPYDRVFMDGTGFAAFKNSTHGRQGCVSCHGGVDGTDNKQTAHSGSFVKWPSIKSDEKCAPCHQGIVSKFANSLHKEGWGQKSMLILRSGASSFDQLPQSMKDGYKANCAKCHATCGDCHVNRPKAGGGGLLKGHQFSKKPDTRENCVACHVSRGGHAFFGIGAGTSPDVHLNKVGDGGCTGCHSGMELHGDGNVYDQRYKMPWKPTCKQCHMGVANSNPYHTVHLNTFSCQTCHSQDYNNCGSCHIGGAGARVPSYLGFKIGLNPIPETKEFKFATLRRSLMAPDSWMEYGVTNLANFDVRPTYKYATPHNINKWTARTKVGAGKACYDNCHIVNDNGTLRNKELYLFNADLDPWERNANRTIVVDGKLPPGWGAAKPLNSTKR